MFDSLTDRLGSIFRGLRGRGRITEDNVSEVMEEIRTALLEADVNLEVARSFCDEVHKKAVGAEVIKTLRPADLMVKLVHDELVRLMGPVDARIPFVSPGPTVLLLAGLQGSGKTTTCAKMAKMLIDRAKRPLMVAADLKRPAAISQLEVLGAQVGCPVYTERDHQNPVKVCRNAIKESRKTDRDVVILDTAGRLAIDEELMDEVTTIASSTSPQQIYLVLDAMTGQDAVNTAKAFNDRLELDGCILTKFDSDTRGGAALSVKHVTGKPIKFVGVGERVEALEEFHPDRIAGRILGMGDILTLVEQAQRQFDQAEAARLESKAAKGRFTLDDFLVQIRKMKNMGSMKDLVKKIPGMSDALGDLDFDEREIVRMEAAIESMTPKERANPKIIDASRRRRIARGAGCDPSDVSQLSKQFDGLRKMMQSMAGRSLGERIRMSTQFSKMMAGGGMPKLKGRTTATRRALSKKDRRKKRRRR
ncbi:MAG: signal recognition particle protein [Phycisphaerae bacterium]